MALAERCLPWRSPRGDAGAHRGCSTTDRHAAHPFTSPLLRAHRSSPYPVEMPVPSEPSPSPPRTNWPLAFFLTFHTYGTWLHGDDRGSVDARHSELGDPIIEPNSALYKRRNDALRQEPLIFIREQRHCVECAMRATCTLRAWPIHAPNIRTTHVHIVVTGCVKPERILGDLKRWATRRLREQGLVAADRLVWSEHGSTRWVWDKAGITETSDYTMNRQ